ncbi:hypothetical protein HMPREF9104_02011 [Lentilactobacillus kisonensis F0435]|uniref:Uncharacterized protein n=1 Tax=Lentilactobacillus kisonensis F0435 TaxID=797516 RepID=H1LHC1_9LACO|nr:hypothetical protein HMPREF9104_02011 [Lentilactobacillus kisonensis F0435]
MKQSTKLHEKKHPEFSVTPHLAGILGCFSFASKLIINSIRHPTS